MIYRANNLPGVAKTKAISNLELQQLYIDLYAEIRRYIWPIGTVSALADLEVATFQACPTLDNIRNSLKTLGILIRDVMSEDELLKEAYESFQSSIEDVNTTYTVLNKVEEVIPVEDTEEESIDEGEWLEAEPEDTEEFEGAELEELEEPEQPEE